MDLVLHSLLIFLCLQGVTSQSICPDGVQQFNLLPAHQNAATTTERHASSPLNIASSPPVGAASQFAVPLQFTGLIEGDVISSNNTGTWITSTNGNTSSSSWQLCLVAPAAPETFSFTVIFSKLQLPLKSHIELNSYFRSASGSNKEDTKQVTQQLINPWDLTGGKKASFPLKGDILMVSYFPLQGAPARVASPRSSFALEIEAVLQGTRPLPFSFPGTTTTTTASLSSSSSLSLSSQNVKDHEVTIDNTGTGLPEQQEPSGSVMLPEDPSLPSSVPPISSQTGSEGVSGEQSPPSIPSPTSNLTVTQIQAARVANRTGAALSCLPDAGCFPEWKNATQATVLLVLISPLGGRFCTGTLLASPTMSPSQNSTTFQENDTNKNSSSTYASEVSGIDQQLILTANHCRKTDDAYTIYNMWGVVFDYGNGCSKDSGENSDSGGGDGSSSSVSDSLAASLTGKILQGLEVVYSDEISDILILRVLSEIPESYNTFFLGWDVTSFPGSGESASTSNSSTSSSSTSSSPPRRARNSFFDWEFGGNVVEYGTVHFAGGDTKKLTNTSSPLRPSKWKSNEDTHVSALWSNGGVTQEGSSGSALVDVRTGLAVGVLTGGPEPDTCADGKDILGTLYAAWERGLWQILSPEGPEKIKKLEGMNRTINGPGIIAAPAYITLQERDMTMPVAAAAVKLSDPPAEGETITITATLFLPPQAVELLASAPEIASISLVEPTQFIFTSENWNMSQRITLDPGGDTKAIGPLPFQIILELSSDITPSLKKRRVLKGIRADEELPSGLTIEDPFIVESGPDGIQARGTGALEAAAEAGGGGGGTFAVKLGDVLTDAEPPGSVYFYNVSTGDTVEMNIVACGIDSPLQIAIFNNSIATWITSEDCSSELAPDCLVQEGVDNCSGFVKFVLPGLSSTLPPYTITVRTINGQQGAYSLIISQSSVPGELFGGPLGTATSVDTGG